MPAQTLWTGIALVVVGVTGYVASAAASPTALIPAFIGAVFVLLGVLARKTSLRKHAMHATLLVALLAFGATAGGVASLIAWLGGATPERPLAVVAKLITALLCVLLIAGGIRSFIAARRAR